MKEVPAIIYLHGLGSSPESPKALLFSQYFASQGYPTVVPSLSLPSLPRLSVTAAIGRVSELVRKTTQERRVVLIGSSLGGFLAVHSLMRLAVDVRAQVAGLVLLAPVLHPWHAQQPIVSSQVEELWMREGLFPIEEGATGALVPVHYRFLEELKECAQESPSVSTTTLVVHGLRDEQVPHQHSAEFVEEHSSARLISLDDDHQMMSEPARLVSVVAEFVRLL